MTIDQKPMTVEVDAYFIRLIAAESSTDPRTVRKILGGGHVRGMARHRIEKVLRDRGLLPPSVPACA